MIERDELAAWLRLTLTPQIGPLAARRLLAAFGSPQAVFDAPATLLRDLAGEREMRALAAVPQELAQQLELTLRWLAASDTHALLSLADPRYPRSLLEAPDPPLLLFAQGQLDALLLPAVAIVGSRHPTAQGLDNARAFAAAFSRGGLVVVSGLALGVDGAAHAGALEGASPTIAVGGTGLDRVYPARHHALAQRIAQQGLLLSECLIGTPPLAQNFPRRNRIIAALGQGTLVVEAAVQSGSLITARLASEMGREVFAIPGSIHSPQSRGCHALIKQGAKLVETAEDVLEELRWVRPAAALPTEAAEDPDGAAGVDTPALPPEDPVLAAMGFDPISQDALAARTGLPPGELSVKLLDLELDGRIARLPGQLFQRRAAG